MTKAGEYLKVASAQLRRAAQMRRSEIDEMRRQIDRREADKRSRISNLKTMEQRTSAMMGNANNDVERAEMTRRISDLRGAEVAVERETNQMRDNLNRQIAYGERQMSAWNQQANQLDQSAYF